MYREEFHYKSADNETIIHGCRWEPDMEPKGIIQIAHGVTEYIERYKWFALQMAKEGYIVVGNDHLGHGLSVAKGNHKMYFGPEGSWNYAVKDLKTCMEMTKEEFPNIPYILLGFSLGSFLVRTLLIDYPEEKVDKVILIGTGQMSPVAIKIAKMLAESEAKKAGDFNSTQKIHDLTFGTYNKRFSPNRTDYDWLCANNEELDCYINDPQRGGDFTAGLFRELLNGMLYTSKVSNIQKMNTNIPVLFLSGADDPVGDFGKGVKKACNAFKKAGVKNIRSKLYSKDRHDILHEKDRKAVFCDILDWIES